MTIDDKPFITNWLDSCASEYRVKLDSEERLMKATQALIESPASLSNEQNTMLIHIADNNIRLYKDYIAKLDEARLLVADLYHDSSEDYLDKVSGAIHYIMVHPINK